MPVQVVSRTMRTLPHNVLKHWSYANPISKINAKFQKSVTPIFR
jgi:hypothetical protein